jgi:hypothetical protein
MSTRTNRVAALGGVGYVILSLVAIFQAPLTDQDNSPEEIHAFLATNPRAGVWAATVILLVDLFGLLLFAARLSIELRGAGRRWEIHASLVVGSAVVYGSVTLFATAVGAGVVQRLPNVPPAADAVTLLDVSAIAHDLSAAVLAVMCVAAAHVSLITRVLPRWTAWLGLIAAAAVLAGTVVLPQTRDPFHYAATVLLAWIVAVSIVLAGHQRPHQPVATTSHTQAEQVETAGGGMGSPGHAGPGSA